MRRKRVRGVVERELGGRVSRKRAVDETKVLVPSKLTIAHLRDLCVLVVRDLLVENALDSAGFKRKRVHRARLNVDIVSVSFLSKKNERVLRERALVEALHEDRVQCVRHSARESEWYLPLRCEVQVAC